MTDSAPLSCKRRSDRMNCLNRPSREWSNEGTGKDGEEVIWAEACTAFQRALTIDANDLRAHYNLADTLEEMGLHAEAVEHWKAYLHQDSQSPWGRLCSQSIVNRKRTPQALISCRNASDCRRKLCDHHRTFCKHNATHFQLWPDHGYGMEATLFEYDNMTMTHLHFDCRTSAITCGSPQCGPGCNAAVCR